MAGKQRGFFDANRGSTIHTDDGNRTAIRKRATPGDQATLNDYLVAVGKQGCKNFIERHDEGPEDDWRERRTLDRTRRECVAVRPHRVIAKCRWRPRTYQSVRCAARDAIVLPPACSGSCLAQAR